MSIVKNLTDNYRSTKVSVNTLKYTLYQQKINNRNLFWYTKPCHEKHSNIFVYNTRRLLVELKIYHF